MKQIVCPNCGANDFVIKDGYKICRYCDTKFISESAEKPKKRTSINLEDDIQELLDKCKREPFRAKRYANLILDIDPTNKEAKKYL